MIARQSSTSSCSASAIDPRTSAKSTVTCFRSLAPSIVISGSRRPITAQMSTLAEMQRVGRRSEARFCFKR